VYRTLSNSGAGLTGFVLNGVKTSGHYGRNYYYYHKYHYRESSARKRA
jgi:hypothetical protein